MMDNSQINRLQWRSRRGLLELDLMLVPFAQVQLTQLSAARQTEYALLLDEEDMDIYDWLQNRATIPDRFVELLLAIRHFHDL